MSGRNSDGRDLSIGTPATFADHERGGSDLFTAGSLLFAVGSVPGYASAVGARWATVTYFVGSLSSPQPRSSLTRRRSTPLRRGSTPAHWRFIVYQPGRIDWWATAV
jgi:hypothetical protein